MCDRIDILRRIKELEKENKVLKEELKCTEINFQICNADLATLGDFVGGNCFDETFDIIKKLIEKPTPKKPYYKDVDEPLCPYCHQPLDGYEEHCEICDQRIDWSDDNA